MKSLVVLLLCIATLANAQDTFTLMTYNAENIFDTKHDEGKTDYEHLPLTLKRGIYRAQTEAACSNKDTGTGKALTAQEEAIVSSRCLNLDWTPKVYDAKLNNIAKVISSYHNGKGADIVVMQEIENIHVMNDLLKKLKLNGHAYTALLEDRDPRGIDVGIISRFPITLTKLHSSNPTSHVKRGIYQFNIQIKNARLTVLGNHWPSQRNPPADRMDASDLLERVAKSITNTDLVVSTGDFNAPETEVPNPVHELYNQMRDVMPHAQRNGLKTFPGSYKFSGKWDVLDRFLIRLADLQQTKIQPVYDSFEIVNNNELIKMPSGTQPTRPGNGGFQGGRTGTTSGRSIQDLDLTAGSPLSFDPVALNGYADHLPVAMEFTIK